MDNKDDRNMGTVIRRVADYKPRRSLSTWLIGRPLPTADAPHQTIGKVMGLAVCTSNALSSTAYATQEILAILAAAGTGAFGYAFPISLAISIAIPTYFFVAMMFTTVGVGFYRYLTGTLTPLEDLPEIEAATRAVATVTPFLILHAFSSGTAALTGIEAISDGITAFKEPRSRNAGLTLIWMAGNLTTLFLGITFLVQPIGAVPLREDT